MVFKGQYLERPTLVPVGDVVLEALSHRGEERPPVLLLPPLPDAGGSMDHVVISELAWAVAHAGFPFLRFNFEGVGASQGRRSADVSSLVADAEAAMRVLLENTGAPGIAVVSLGGSAAVALELQSRHPSVGGVCLIGPEGIEVGALARLRCPLLVVTGEHDLRQPRAALAAVVTGNGGTLQVVEKADAQFSRNLPQVGKATVGWLRGIAGLRP
jgi:alpha/beta superfamily hydrolase